MRIGYARVSTIDQNLDLQLAALEREDCDLIFQDHASGIDTQREGYLEALQTIQPGDMLVVWRLDRLARSLCELSDTVRGLDKRGIGFRSLCEYIDMGSASGEFVLHILSAMAHFERSLIIERTKAGMAAAKARGVTFGRAPALNDEELHEALDLIGKGQSVASTAEELGIGRSTLYRYLAALQAA